MLLVWGCPFIALAEADFGLAMHGSPLEGQDFSHFSYTNEDAPQGGRRCGLEAAKRR